MIFDLLRVLIPSSGDSAIVSTAAPSAVRSVDHYVVHKKWKIVHFKDRLLISSIVVVALSPLKTN